MLASYAATAQVCFLSSDLMKPAVRQMTQNQIAQKWRKIFPARGTDPSDHVPPDKQKTRDNTATGLFSRRLRKPTATFLRQVDHILLRRAPQLLRAGGLASFHARLHGVRTLDNVESSASLLYTAPLLLEKADEAIVVLIQASALLAKFEDDDHVRFGMDAEDRRALDRVVNGLILIGGLPPTPYSVDALLFLGSLSRFAFNEVKTELEKALRKPLGFRTWRAITAVVAAIKAAKETNTVSGSSVRQWVKNQLEACELLREHSLYPARSLDLELAIVIPRNGRIRPWAIGRVTCCAGAPVTSQRPYVSVARPRSACGNERSPARSRHGSPLPKPSFSRSPRSSWRRTASGPAPRGWPRSCRRTSAAGARSSPTGPTLTIRPSASSNKRKKNCKKYRTAFARPQASS